MAPVVADPFLGWREVLESRGKNRGSFVVVLDDPGSLGT